MTKILVGLFLLFALEFYAITVIILYFSRGYFKGISNIKRSKLMLVPLVSVALGFVCTFVAALIGGKI